MRCWYSGDHFLIHLNFPTIMYFQWDSSTLLLWAVYVMSVNWQLCCILTCWNKWHGFVLWGCFLLLTHHVYFVPVNTFQHKEPNGNWIVNISSCVLVRHRWLGQNTLLLHEALVIDLWSLVTASHSDSSVHSVMLSVHFFGGLPLCRMPSTDPSSTVFISRSFGMLLLCLN